MCFHIKKPTLTPFPQISLQKNEVIVLATFLFLTQNHIRIKREFTVPADGFPDFRNIDVVAVEQFDIARVWNRVSAKVMIRSLSEIISKNTLENV